MCTRQTSDKARDEGGERSAVLHKAGPHDGSFIVSADTSTSCFAREHQATRHLQPCTVLFSEARWSSGNALTSRPRFRTRQPRVSVLGHLRFGISDEGPHPLGCRQYFVVQGQVQFVTEEGIIGLHDFAKSAVLPK
jgi:hypothetical protein